MLTDSAGTPTVTRTASIESQLSVDAGPLSNNLTACSGNGVTSVFDRNCQKVPESQQSEPRGTPNDKTTHLHISNTCPVLYTQGHPEDQHDIVNDASSLSSSQSTSSLQKDWETKLKEYANDYCEIDVMILYSEDDRKEVEKFKIHLETEINVPGSQRVNVVLYDELSFTGLSFDNLEQAFDQCSYTFVYLTKSFVKNTWCKITSESCLMKVINDMSSTKRWKVVPVHTKRKEESDFSAPMGLNALKGIHYYKNDEYYTKGVASLILKGREEVEREKQQSLKRQNFGKELLTAKRHTNTASQEKKESIVRYTECSENSEVTCMQEQYRQSDSCCSQLTEPGTIKWHTDVPPAAEKLSYNTDSGITDEFGSLLFEDNGSNISNSDQTVLEQGNIETQRTSDIQKQDQGKQSQGHRNLEESYTERSTKYLGAESKVDVSAAEVDADSVPIKSSNGVTREKPVGVVRPSSQMTSISYRHCHIWQLCSVHGRHHKVFEWFYQNKIPKDTPEDILMQWNVNTID